MEDFTVNILNHFNTIYIKMKLDSLPTLVLELILNNLTIRELVKLSEVNSYFNILCKEKKTDLYKNFLDLTGR